MEIPHTHKQKPMNESAQWSLRAPGSTTQARKSQAEAKRQGGTSLTVAVVLGYWQAVQMVSTIAVGLHVGNLPESPEY